MSNFFRIGIAAMSMLACGTVAADSADSNAAFDQYCMACHGPDGRGVSGLGPDLIASKLVAGQSEDALVEFLRQGRLADDPASVTGRPMPGFSWVTDAELKSIAAFLRAQSARGRM